jgi:hypothetical protein
MQRGGNLVPFEEVVDGLVGVSVEDGVCLEDENVLGGRELLLELRAREVEIDAVARAEVELGGYGTHLDASGFNGSMPYCGALGRFGLRACFWRCVEDDGPLGT